MSTKLFVGGLSWNTDDESLQSGFEKYGEIVDVKVIKDRETGRSRGFGFVTFAQKQDAQNAMQELDGKEFEGRAIKVNEAHDKPRGERNGNGYR